MKDKRTKKGQGAHDRGVINWVKNMQSQGFEVKADLPGMKKPDSIHGKVPDGYAKKGKIEKMVEVETPETLKSDVDQRAKFRKWSGKNPNRTFSTKVIRKKGK